MTFSTLAHLTHSNVRKSNPSLAGAVWTIIIGLWHSRQGRPPIMFDVNAEDDSERVMVVTTAMRQIRERTPLVAVTGGKSIMRLGH